MRTIIGSRGRAFDAPRSGDEEVSAGRHKEPLERLAIALGSVEGCSVELIKPQVRPLRLIVTSDFSRRLAEAIRTEVDDRGMEWFVWSWGERMCQVGELDAAVSAIRRIFVVVNDRQCLK